MLSTIGTESSPANAFIRADLPSITGSDAFGPDVAEAQHGGAVGDDGDHPGCPGVVPGRRRIGGDQAGHPGHPGRVEHGQVAPVDQRRAQRHRQLAAAVCGQHVVGGEVGGPVGAGRRAVPGVATAVSRPRPAGMVVGVGGWYRWWSAWSTPGLRGAGGIRWVALHGLPRLDAIIVCGMARVRRPQRRGRSARSDAVVRSAAKRSARQRQIGHGGTSTAGPLGLIGPSGCSGDSQVVRVMRGFHHDAGQRPRNPNRRADPSAGSALRGSLSRSSRHRRGSAGAAGRPRRPCASRSICGCQVDVLGGDAALGMRGQHEQHVPPADVDVRVMTGRLGGHRDRVDQRDPGRKSGAVYRQRMSSVSPPHPGSVARASVISAELSSVMTLRSPPALRVKDRPPVTERRGSAPSAPGRRLVAR